MTVQFICRGNTFRSIIAEAYLNSLQIQGLTVLSSGTVASRDKHENRANFPRTLALLKRHGIEQFAKDHYGDDTSQKLLDESDIVVCFNDTVYKEANKMFRLPKKTLVWNVLDLGEGNRIVTSEATRERYMEDVYNEISKEVDGMAATLNLNSH